MSHAFTLGGVGGSKVPTRAPRLPSAVSNDLFGHGLLSPLPAGEGEGLLSARHGTPHPRPLRTGRGGAPPGPGRAAAGHSAPEALLGRLPTRRDAARRVPAVLGKRRGRFGLPLHHEPVANPALEAEHMTGMRRPQGAAPYG